MSDDIEVRFGVDIEKLKAGLETAAAVVKSQAENMTSAFGNLSSAFSGLNSIMATTAAILAGGSLFKSAIDKSLEFTSESVKLSKALGITATEASTLNVALGDIRSDADSFVTATRSLTKQLRLNEDSLNTMGVATRTSTGEFRNMKDIMTNSLDVLRGYKEGTDRNLAAQVLFKNGASEAVTLLKLNNVVLEDAKRKQEELGLVVGQENVAASKAYKAALNDISDVFLGLKKAIGDVLIPILTQFANWFSDVGPTAVKITKAAINELAVVFYSLSNGITVVWETLKAFIASISISIISLATSIAKAITGDIEGAKIALTTASDSLEEIWKEAGNNILDSSTKTWDKIKALYSQPISINEKVKEGKDFVDPKGKDDKDLAAARYALAKAQAEAENAIIQDNLKRAESLYDEAYAKNLVDTKGYYDAKIAIQTESLNKEIELRKKEISHANDEIANSTKKGTPEGDKEVLKFRAELAKVTADLTILEANRAELVTRLTAKEIEEERKRADQIESIRIGAREKLANSEVTIDEIAAQEKFDMGLINNSQLIELQRQFEERRNAIATEALQERLALEINGPNDPIAVAQLNAQLEDLALQHSLKMKEIVSKAAIEANLPWTTVFKTMQSSLQTALDGILTKTQTLKQALTTVFSSIGQSIITELVTKPLAAKAVAWISEKFFGIGEITKNAAVAGSGAVAAMAGIPIVGPALAAAAGPATFAAALAYAPVAASAQGGFDIPSNLNPITQLHASEMVLPAKHADVIRGLAENGLSGKGDSYNIEVKAMDAKGVKQFFDEHGKSLVSALKNQSRNFVGK